VLNLFFCYFVYEPIYKCNHTHLIWLKKILTKLRKGYSDRLAMIFVSTFHLDIQWNPYEIRVKFQGTTKIHNFLLIIFISSYFSYDLASYKTSFFLFFFSFESLSTTITVRNFCVSPLDLFFVRCFLVSSTPFSPPNNATTNDHHQHRLISTSVGAQH